jgi:hypothetical protein
VPSPPSSFDDGAAETAMRDALEPGERLLWSGRPRQGLLLRRGDAILIPATLVPFAFAVFLEAVVVAKGCLADGGAVAMALLIGSVVVATLHLVVGRFFLEAYQRARTFYGVSDRRVLIVFRFYGSRALAFALERVTEIDLKADRGGLGTLTFGRSDRSIRIDAPIFGLQSKTRKFAQFAAIEHADDVLRLIQEAQRTMARVPDPSRRAGCRRGACSPPRRG